MKRQASPTGQVDILAAQADLAGLITLLESGAAAEIVITREGKPAARLLPIARLAKAARRLGMLEGQFPSTSQEEFDASDDAVLKLFDSGE
jgi:antitoxin (DNA-binding transcriptional repressor) of toxin-antitoxin stability system